MRLSDSVILIAVYLIFSFCVSGSENQIQKIESKSFSLKQEVDANYFIEKSFRETCRDGLYEDLNQWQSNCRKLYGLDYIAWCNAEDFMDVSYENCDDLLFYGIWELKGKRNEVYCRKKTKK